MCLHLLEHSLGRTSVKKTAKILVFWAICKLCCWYLTVETALGGEIGNFPAYAMLQKYSWLSIGPSREASLGKTNKLVWVLSCCHLEICHPGTGEKAGFPHGRDVVPTAGAGMDGAVPSRAGQWEQQEPGAPELLHSGLMLSCPQGWCPAALAARRDQRRRTWMGTGLCKQLWFALHIG